MTDVTFVVTPLRPVQFTSVNIPGPPGSDGSTIVQSQFTITVAGDQSIAMPSQIGSWTSLHVNGLRQDPSSYSYSGNMLQLPGSLIWVGADCLFEYFPITG